MRDVGRTWGRQQKERGEVVLVRTWDSDRTETDVSIEGSINMPTAANASECVSTSEDVSSEDASTDEDVEIVERVDAEEEAYIKNEVNREEEFDAEWGSMRRRVPAQKNHTESRSPGQKQTWSFVD